jgi:hypothetical protein
MVSQLKSAVGTELESETQIPAFEGLWAVLGQIFLQIARFPSVNPSRVQHPIA